jgi:hypothetical protein
MVLVVGAAHMTQRGEDRDYNLKKDSVTAKKLRLQQNRQYQPKSALNNHAPIIPPMMGPATGIQL